MKKFKKLSIIIPSYNEENYIAACLERVFKANSLGLNKEIIVVDDGSTDSTPRVLKKIEKKYKPKSRSKSTSLEIIYKKKNQGKGAALKTGFLKSTGDIVLVQDADLEYNPEEYPLLLNPFIKDGADVVYGSRLATSQPHRVLFFWHYVANKLLTTLSNMFTNLNLTDMETGYKVFKGDLIRKIAPKLESDRFGFEPEITARIAKIKGIKIFEVGISYSGRTYEEGKKIGAIDGVMAFWQIIKYNLFSS